MIQTNKNKPVDCSNNTQMVEEGIRPPFAFRKEDAWLNEVQQPRKKRFFYNQQTKEVKAAIKNILNLGDVEDISYIRKHYQGIPT